MEQYHKIQTLYKRTQKGELLLGQWSLPVFEYLRNAEWYGTEKVDGTNIRVFWSRDSGLKIGGKTDNAQIPAFLYDRLQEILPADKFGTAITKTDSLTLYGEGYGARIQKGGGNYNPKGVDFVLFDVQVDGWWLRREDVLDVAECLGIKAVPQVFCGSLREAIDFVRPPGFNSGWGTFAAEGLVLRPAVELRCRNGHRVITKIKTKDFARAIQADAHFQKGE